MTPGRSDTGNHNLLPASLSGTNFQIPEIPISEKSLVKLTGGVVVRRYKLSRR